LGARKQIPPLLAGFGVSIVERAVIDAFCVRPERHLPRRSGPIHWLNLAAIHPELAGLSPCDLLPPLPERSVIVRHTVGMADPLSMVEEHDHPDDGLPLSLGISHAASPTSKFTVGRKHRAGPANVCAGSRRSLKKHTSKYFFTLDGNENYQAVEPFRALWEGFSADPAITRFLRHLSLSSSRFTGVASMKRRHGNCGVGEPSGDHHR